MKTLLLTSLVISNYIFAANIEIGSNYMDASTSAITIGNDNSSYSFNKSIILGDENRLFTERMEL